MMRKYLKYSLILLAGTFMVSCDDYLKTTSGDLLIPTSISEYIPILYGEGYPLNFNTEVSWISIMTDDVEVSPLEWDEANYSKPADGFDLTYGGDSPLAYQWAINIEEKITDQFWSSRYSNILGCNTIIQALPTMEYTEIQSGKYNLLAAQAYALRAYHYFCLVNTYALPWSTENLDELGVVIKTSPDISITAMERSTIGEVYKLINEDIKAALDYIKLSEPSANKHLIGPAAIKLLASRVALFQQQWDETIRIGEEFIDENNTIFDLNSVDITTLGTDSDSDFYIRDTRINNEIVFTFGNSSRINYLSISVGGALWEVGVRTSKNDIYSDDNPSNANRKLLQKSLLSCYEDGDLRELAFFKQDVWTSMWGREYWDRYYHLPLKFKRPTARTANYECWRTVEVLLNVAEAYAQGSAGISQDAIGLMNKLREKRFTPETYVAKTTLDFASKQELIEFIWEERRRELCFDELIRWWDLRRQGMPQIIHKYYRNTTSYDTYILEKGGNNYTLPIPRSETKVNDRITNNSRDNITHS